MKINMHKSSLLFRVLEDSRPGQLIDSWIMVELKILVVILCHDHAVMVNWAKINCNQLLPTIESENLVKIMIDSKSAFISPQSFVSAKLFPVDRRQLYLCGVLFTPDDHLVVSTGNELLVNDPTATDILEKVLIINDCLFWWIQGVSTWHYTRKYHRLFWPFCHSPTVSYYRIITVPSFQRNHNTLETACRVSILSKESWPYKRVELTYTGHNSV